MKVSYRIVLYLFLLNPMGFKDPKYNFMAFLFVSSWTMRYYKFVFHVWVWYKLRIIISHVCLFFSTWGTGQIETSSLFHLSQWAAVWSFNKWIRLSKVQTLPSRLSCIFCMFSELRPLVFQQVIRIPADSSSLTSAFAHCFKFYFIFSLHVWHLKISFSLCWAWLYIHKFLKCTFL